MSLVGLSFPETPYLGVTKLPSPEELDKRQLTTPANMGKLRMAQLGVAY
jgi:hypothetical protein